MAAEPFDTVEPPANIDSAWKPVAPFGWQDANVAQTKRPGLVHL